MSPSRATAPWKPRVGTISLRLIGAAREDLLSLAERSNGPLVDERLLRRKARLARPDEKRVPNHVPNCAILTRSHRTHANSEALRNRQKPC
jgi:hypothetical protein